MEQIELKKMVNTAVRFLDNLYDQAGLRNVLLEEIERSEDSGHWLVTLGFDVDFSPPPTYSITDLLNPTKPQRIYKTIEIDEKTGEALAMKMRTE
jgi:hypothetical protein